MPQRLRKIQAGTSTAKAIMDEIIAGRMIAIMVRLAILVFYSYRNDQLTLYISPARSRFYTINAYF